MEIFFFSLFSVWLAIKWVFLNYRSFSAFLFSLFFLSSSFFKLTTTIIIEYWIKHIWIVESNKLEKTHHKHPSEQPYAKMFRNSATTTVSCYQKLWRMVMSFVIDEKVRSMFVGAMFFSSLLIILNDSQMLFLLFLLFAEDCSKWIVSV